MKILIADDSVVVRKMLSMTIEKWGYETLAATTGQQALDILSETDGPSLGILDWMMPGRHGVDVCRKARTHVTQRPLYLIMLTSRDGSANIVQALDAGADDYLTKPYDVEELRARLSVGKRVVELQWDLAERVDELRAALDHVKTLQGIIPICMHCHRIRDDSDAWNKLETYIAQHSEAKFSHGLCPQCLELHYPA